MASIQTTNKVQLVGQAKGETLPFMSNQPHYPASDPTRITPGTQPLIRKQTYRLSPLCSNLILTSLCQRNDKTSQRVLWHVLLPGKQQAVIQQHQANIPDVLFQRLYPLGIPLSNELQSSSSNLRATKFLGQDPQVAARDQLLCSGISSLYIISWPGYRSFLSWLIQKKKILVLTLPSYMATSKLFILYKSWFFHLQHGAKHI